MGIDIGDLTVNQVREVAAFFGSSSAAQRTPFEVGKSYLFRTVTYTKVGRVREVIGGFVVLDDASWVADTGRYSEAIDSGSLGEVERVPDGGGVAIGALVDYEVWHRPLPKVTK